MKKYFKLVLGSSLLLSGCTGTSPQLGVQTGMLKSCPDSPNCVNSQAKDEKHNIEPIKFSGTVSEAKKKLTTVIKSLENSQIIVSDSNYIRAEFTSSIFRFVDDVEFYLVENEAEKVIVHLRSASRIGHSDMGVNRKRMEEIRSAISKK
jgi:uncharacterized protein (DUF1499 family)